MDSYFYLLKFYPILILALIFDLIFTLLFYYSVRLQMGMHRSKTRELYYIMIN